MINKQLSIIGENSQHVTTAELLSIVIDKQAIEGLTVGQMRKRIPMCEKLVGLGVGEKIPLSKDELKTVSAIYERHQFGFMHRDLIQVADLLKGAINDEA